MLRDTHTDGTAMPYAYTKSLFTEEHEIFRDSYRRFLATEADAHVDEWLEKGAVPKSFWQKAGEQGFLAVGVPEEYGGPGGDFLHRVVIAEELGYSIAGASIAPSVIGDGIAEILYKNAAPHLLRRRTRRPPPIRQSISPPSTPSSSAPASIFFRSWTTTPSDKSSRRGPRACGEGGRSRGIPDGSSPGQYCS